MSGLVRIDKIIADGDGVKGRRFTIDTTRPVLVVGPNGSGKSARIVAPFLALQAKTTGSAVPTMLGDTAEDTGSVEVTVHGRTPDGGDISVFRRLGKRHRVTAQIGPDSATKAKDAEALLAGVLDNAANRAQPLDLGWFVGMKPEDQARLVARVAGVTLEDEERQKALGDRLAGIRVEYEDARQRDQVASPEGQLVADLVGQAVAEGLDAAQETAREAKNEAQREKLQAKKTRDQLVDLRPEDLPPGSLAEAKRREQTARDDRERVAAKLEVRGQRVEERRRAQKRAEGLHARIAEMQEPADEAPAADRPDVRALEETHAAAEARLDAARAATSEASHAGGEPHARRRQVEDAIADLSQQGTCPTCGTTGGALDDALAALRRRRVALKVKFGRAERAAVAAGEAQDQAHTDEREARARLDAGRRLAHGMESAASTAAAERRAYDQAQTDLAAAEEELDGLPAVEGEGDLEGVRQQLEADLTQAAADIEQLAGAEEAERERAQNEQLLDDATRRRALWAALEKALGAFSAELAQQAESAVSDHADRIIGACYPAGDRGFAFRPPPEKEDAAPFGFGMVEERGDHEVDWRPYSALSDSEQIVCGVALVYALQQLAARPFVPMVIDRLEALDRDRALALVRVLAEAHFDGRLSLVLIAWRSDADEESECAELEGSGVQVIFAARDRHDAPAVLTYPHPTDLTNDDHVYCTGPNGDRQDRMTVEAHRARGCLCGAEDRERARRAAAAKEAA